MADLNQRSTAIHGIRRVSNHIMAEDFEGDHFVCAQQMTSLQMHFERFTTAHDTLVGNAADDDELATHQALWDDMEALYNPAIVKLIRMMAAEPAPSIQPSHDDSADSSRSANAVAMMNLKLDPVTIPQFDGSLRNWLAFKDAIQTLLDKPEIPEYYKLQKLRASLVGDSLSLAICIRAAIRQHGMN